MKIGFIGLGNMAQAMIGGILKNKLAGPEEILGSAKTAETEQKIREKFGICTTGNNERTAHESDVLFLAVKPQFFPEVIEQIKGLNYAGKTIVSIAPGKTLDWLAEQFGNDLAFVRAMPNTPALVGEGCTAACFSDRVDEASKETVMEILGSFGKAFEVPERLMDVVPGVSGCAPAWVFMMLEAMADGAVAEGMPRKQAYEFAAQAVLGSAKLMLETGKHPGELKDMVCSPAGSTIQAVRVLEEKNFRGAMMDAVIACIEKSRAL
ncbi:MAG: pyrroline-5-carboxylate reductase [Eubacteriales bacterium]|nr:pyrroline-5-carboxylate reductase [Eubacteriales bacterium]